MTILKLEYSIYCDFYFTLKGVKNKFLGSIETLLIIAGIFDTCTFEKRKEKGKSTGI